MDSYRSTRDSDTKDQTCYLHAGELEKLTDKVERVQEEVRDLRELVVGEKPQENSGLRGDFLSFKSKINFIFWSLVIFAILYAPTQLIALIKLLPAL